MYKDPGNNSNGYLVEEMYNPRLSMHDFTGLTPPPGLDPDPDNRSLNIDVHFLIFDVVLLLYLLPESTLNGIAEEWNKRQTFPPSLRRRRLSSSL